MQHLERLSYGIAGVVTLIGTIFSVVSYARGGCLIIPGAGPPICGSDARYLVWVLHPLSFFLSWIFLRLALRQEQDRKK